MRVPPKSGNSQVIYVAATLLVIAHVLTLLPTGIYGCLIGSAIVFCFLPGSLLVLWLLEVVLLRNPGILLWDMVVTCGPQGQRNVLLQGICKVTPILWTTDGQK